MMQQAKYSDICKLLQPGDLFAFAGKGKVSELIQQFTHSQVSHVANVFDSDGRMIQSTTMGGHDGVSVDHIADELIRYTGRVWALRLAPAMREKFQGGPYFDSCLKQVNRPYNYQGIVNFGWRKFIPFAKDKGRLGMFCSQRCADSWIAAGVLGKEKDACEYSPADIVALPMFSPDYFQLVGEPMELFKS